MSQYSELKRLAEAATPGEWERADGCEVSVSYEGDESYWSWEAAGPAQLHGAGSQAVADADYIAAANPAAILALIAENERLREDRDSQQRVCIRVMEERDQLKAENERLQASLQGYQMGAKAEAEEADRLRGENERLTNIVGDLCILTKRFVHRLRKAAPGNDLPEQALDYLKRKGLQGSPLRSAEENS